MAVFFPFGATLPWAALDRIYEGGVKVSKTRVSELKWIDMKELTWTVSPSADSLPEICTRTTELSRIVQTCMMKVLQRSQNKSQPGHLLPAACRDSDAHSQHNGCIGKRIDGCLKWSSDFPPQAWRFERSCCQEPWTMQIQISRICFLGYGTFLWGNHLSAGHFFL